MTDDTDNIAGAVAASTTCSLSLALNAYGTPNQLVVFLRNAADQIERDSTRHPLPWFSIQTGGGFMGDFKVNPANYQAMAAPSQRHEPKPE